MRQPWPSAFYRNSWDDRLWRECPSAALPPRFTPARRALLGHVSVEERKRHDHHVQPFKGRRRFPRRAGHRMTVPRVFIVSAGTLISMISCCYGETEYAWLTTVKILNY